MTHLFARKIPLIAVCHLPALAGTQNHTSQRKVIDHALHDLALCEELGVDGLLFENENDKPYDVEVKGEVIASMSALLMKALSQRKNVKVGVEYLINDPFASLATAYACGAEFIRTDYFVDRMARAEYGGEMKISPRELVSQRNDYANRGHFIQIFADVQVKYAEMLEADRPLWRSCQEAHKVGAEAAIISGVATGSAPRASDFEGARAEGSVGKLYIGSGLSAVNAEKLLPVLDGAIVGTSLMTNGVFDREKIKELLSYFERERSLR